MRGKIRGMSYRQSCKYCGSVVGVHQHSRTCPRFKACKHCGHDLGRYEKKKEFSYHCFCSPLVDDGIVEVTRP